MTASKNIRYIPAIDHLRAYAALLVILYHCALVLVPLQDANWPKATNPFMSLIYEGHSGVALFLVLSGFIFTYGSAGRDIEYKPFLLNRILRIYPLLIALVFVGISIYASQLSPTQVIALLLPVQNLRAAGATTYLGPYNAALWTITVEFQFYLIFPFLHRQLLHRGVSGLVPLIAFLILARWSALLIGDSALFSSSRDIAYWTILGRLDQFLIGMIAATFALRLTFASRLLRWALPLGVVGLGLALYLFNQEGGWPNESGWKVLWPTCEAALWALIILGYLAVLHGRNGWITKMIAAVGTISYSMYLLHIVVIDIFVHHGLVLSVPRSPLLSALFTALACVFPVVVLVSALTYHAIEKPFLQLRRRYLAPEPGAQSILHPTAMVTGDEATAAALGRRGLIACFAGVSVLIVAGLLFTLHLHRESNMSVTARAIHPSVERALAVSHEIRPSGYKVLVAGDESASMAVNVGLQLARAGQPFVVSGGRWKNSFGAQHDWRSLDANALKNGLSTWYVMPRSMLLGGVIVGGRNFPLRDGAFLVLTPPTLELSTAGNTLEIDFTIHDHAKDFILGGWEDIGAGGTWSTAPLAAMAFRPQVVEGTQVEISVDAQPFLSPAHGLTKQRLHLFFNGIPLGPEQQLSATGRVQFTVPEAIWNEEAAKLDGQVSLVFEFPDAVVPASLGPNADGDPRLLSLYFLKMRFRVTP